MSNTSQRTYTVTNISAHKFSKIPLGILGAAGAFTFFAQQFYADEDKSEKTTTHDKEAFNVSGIRTLSSPEEIFQKFASIEKNGQKFMTTSDFLRVITPYENIGNYDTSSFEGDLTSLLQSIDVDSDGLINYAEFIYFTTFLSIPPKYSRIAFRMFDKDSSGDIDVEEFKSMMKLISQSNPITSAIELSDIFAGTADGGFPAFFGKDGKQCLPFDKFYTFIKRLRDEVATVQFKMISNGRDTISAQEYASSLLSYGTSRENAASMNRISQLESSPIRITIEEYKAFLKVFESLDEIDFILRSFVSVGEPFSKEQLKRAARAVSKVELSDNVLEVVFFVFDTNGDGKLDDREFIGTLQGHNQFGFSKPKDNGFVRFGKCMRYCWNEEISDRSAKFIQ